MLVSLLLLVTSTFLFVWTFCWHSFCDLWLYCWCCYFWLLLLIRLGFVLSTCRVTRKKMTALSARVQAGQFHISYAGTSYLYSLYSFVLSFLTNWQWSWWCYMWWLYACTACSLAHIRALLVMYCRLCSLLRVFQHIFMLLLSPCLYCFYFCCYYKSKLYICVIVAYSRSPRRPAP